MSAAPHRARAGTPRSTCSLASQGREIGRDGRVEVRVDGSDGPIEIGGDCVTCILGALTF